MDLRFKRLSSNRKLNAGILCSRFASCNVKKSMFYLSLHRLELPLYVPLGFFLLLQLFFQVVLFILELAQPCVD